MKHTSPPGRTRSSDAAQEVVVDAEARVGPVAHVCDLVLAEGHIADHQVEPVLGQRHVFSNGDIRTSTPPGAYSALSMRPDNPVDLDGGDAAALGQIAAASRR
jgi:hypothetical protein